MGGHYLIAPVSYLVLRGPLEGSHLIFDGVRDHVFF